MKRAALIASLLFAGISFAATPQSASSNGKSLGNPQAPIRIDLYSDFQCPGCKWLHENTIRPLVQDYVNAGKVYLVQREYPQAMHAHAREAACYASAAEKIGKYQIVGQELFRTQDEWEKDGNVAGAACRLLSTVEAGKVRALALSPEILSLVNDDIRAGHNENVDGTPTMIITKLIRRYPVAGPVSYPVLRRFLDSLLP